MMTGRWKKVRRRRRREEERTKKMTMRRRKGRKRWQEEGRKEDEDVRKNKKDNDDGKKESRKKTMTERKKGRWWWGEKEGRKMKEDEGRKEGRGQGMKLCVPIWRLWAPTTLASPWTPARQERGRRWWSRRCSSHPWSISSEPWPGSWRTLRQRKSRWTPVHSDQNYISYRISKQRIARKRIARASVRKILASVSIIYTAT